MMSRCKIFTILNQFHPFSVSCDSEKVTNYVEVLKIVLLVEISVVLGLPEATGTHVKSRLALLQADKRRQVFIVRWNFLLALLDNFFRCKVHQLLHLSSIVGLIGEVSAHDMVYNILNTCLDVSEGPNILILSLNVARFFGSCFIMLCCVDHVSFFVSFELIN